MTKDLRELSPELVGKINKARLFKAAKSAAAERTLNRAIKKAWLKSKVGIVKEVSEAERIPRKANQPANSKKHSDLYTDENPKGTIHGLKFTTAEDARSSVSKIRNSDRSHAHKIQAAVAMEQRAKVANKHEAASIYRKFIDSMKKKTNEDIIKEDLGGAEGNPTTGGIANVAGVNVSTDPVHWSKRQPKVGLKGKIKKYGQPMVFKAVMRRKEANEATVYYKAIGKRVKAVSRTSAMGNGSDGSGGESIGREDIDQNNTIKAVSQLKLALLAKKTQLQSASDNEVYDIIDKIMTRIAKVHGISGKKLHDMWVKKYDQIPDTWIMKQNFTDNKNSQYKG